MVFILVPDDGSKVDKQVIQAAQRACRIAHQMDLWPISPSLYCLSYMSVGEYSMELRALSRRWLRRCDRIWIMFPGTNEDYLDSLTYETLDGNQQLGSREYGKGRRPVYQLVATGEDKIGMVPMAMSRDSVRELLNVNLTAGLTAHCM
jgi:hypothetical protein